METDKPFFDRDDIEHLHFGRYLPHWHQDGRYVFVTFRLADSLPQAKLREYAIEKEQWFKLHPRPWSKEDEKEYYRRFFDTFDKWLDSNYGSCLLADSRYRTIVEKALHYYDGTHYELVAYVVMANHVHLLVRMLGEVDVRRVIQSLKSFTAKEINKVAGTQGRIWQSESFDRIIRDKHHLHRVIDYIFRNNPTLAWIR